MIIILIKFSQIVLLVQNSYCVQINATEHEPKFKQ